MIENTSKVLGPKWTYNLFRLIRTLYSILDFISTTVFGYSLIHGRIEKEKNAQLSGHLVKILGRCTDCPASQVFLDRNFILQHHSYVDPIDFVIHNDFVTLMGANKTHAWFCISPHFDVYDSSIIPFAFLAQYLNAQKLLIVDHATLHQIAEKVQLRGKCIMINNTARCGSTLLCQIFKKLPKTVVQSEPWSLLYIHRLYNQREICWAEYQMLIESFIKMQFKPTVDKSTDLYVIKLPFLCAAMFNPIKTIFGDQIRFLFSVRHLKPSITSFVKILKSLDPKDWLDKDRFWTENIGFPYQEKYRPMYKKYHAQRKTLTDVQKVTLASGAALINFRENLEMYDFVAVYEEMMGNVSEKVTQMFEAFEIPKIHVKECIKVLDTHSQKKMFEGRHQVEEIDAHEWKKADRILEEFQLPFKIGMSTDQFIASI